MRHGRHYAMGNTAETRLYGRTVTPLRQGRRAAGCALPHSEDAATIVFRHGFAGGGFAGVRAKRAPGGAGFDGATTARRARRAGDCARNDLARERSAAHGGLFAPRARSE